MRKVEAAEDLQFIFLLYKKEYIEMEKPHVAKRLEDGLTELLKYMLKQNSD